jgi:HD-GYP domain-containing protein (c-di-GMP phosphodiesterase class II)
MTEREGDHGHGPPVRGDELASTVALLRREILGGGSRAAVERTLDRVTSCVATVAAEHDGMTNELLSIYEQLGVIFEVTHRLPDIRDEQEILQHFVSSLSRTFLGCRVDAASPRGNGRWRFHTAGAECPPWLVQLLDASRTSTTVTVHSSRSGTGDVLIGPIHAGEVFVCSVILQRDDERDEMSREGGERLLHAPTSGETTFQASDMLLVESLATFCGDLVRNLRLVSELRQASIAMVRALVSAVDQKDHYTSGHSLRVASYSTLLGKELGLLGEELQMLQWSALLHDVGKIGIRDEVLQKAGKLSPDELRHIQEHPVRSYEVVKGIPQLAPALAGALHHHEHYDGGGYPSGLSGENIPRQARIIQVADIFDALTSNRSYRGAFAWEKALDIMRSEAGKTVDPWIFDTFDRMIRRILAPVTADAPAEVPHDRTDLRSHRGLTWEELTARAEQFSLSAGRISEAIEGE